MRTRHRRLSAAAALTIAASLAMAGCGADTSTDAPATSQTTTAGSSPAALARALAPDETEASDPTAGPTDTLDKSVLVDQQAPPELTVTEIRVGEHGGKDRVVFELEGTGVPGYTVNYVDAPAQQGSGNPVDVGGDSFLQVTIDGQALPTTTGSTEVPVGVVAADGVSDVAGVAFAGQFEGRAQSVIGLEGSDRAFSAFLLQNPTRLVVDVER